MSSSGASRRDRADGRRPRRRAPTDSSRAGVSTRSPPSTIDSHRTSRRASRRGYGPRAPSLPRGSAGPIRRRGAGGDSTPTPRIAPGRYIPARRARGPIRREGERDAVTTRPGRASRLRRPPRPSPSPRPTRHRSAGRAPAPTRVSPPGSVPWSASRPPAPATSSTRAARRRARGAPRRRVAWRRGRRGAVSDSSRTWTNWYERASLSGRVCVLSGDARPTPALVA